MLKLFRMRRKWCVGVQVNPSLKTAQALKLAYHSDLGESLELDVY